MRISRKAWIIIGIGIFAVILSILYTFYFRELGELEQLQNRLDDAKANNLAFNITLTDLKVDLASAQSDLKKYQVEFPVSLESIEYDDDLFEIADDCNVAIASIAASTPTSGKVGAVTYSISSFAVDVSGDIDDILDFIYAIRTGDDFELPWSAEVTRINIAGGTASIYLNIYGYIR